MNLLTNSTTRAFLPAILATLFLSRSLFVFYHRLPMQSTPSVHQLSLQLSMPALESLCGSESSDIESTEKNLVLDKDQMILVYQALAYAVVFFVAAYYFNPEGPSTRQQIWKKSKNTISDIPRAHGIVWKRYIINFSVFYSLALTEAITRSINAGSPLLPQSINEALINDSVWQTLRTMYMVSHPAGDLGVWLTHTLITANILWIVIAPSWRYFANAMGVASLLFASSVIAHSAYGSPEQYCIRNAFLESWDQRSVLHVFTHVGTEIFVMFTSMVMG